MKRKHVSHYEELNPHYSFFKWYRCSKCGDEFRREKGWRALIGGYHRYIHAKYLCHNCAPTREDADKYFLNLHWMKPKGPPPPPPPIPIKGNNGVKQNEM